MTRLQNAKNQLVEALAALESAASQLITASNEANAPANQSQTFSGADVSALVDEVSIIEARLTQAMTMIASIESGRGGHPAIKDGDTQ